MIPLLYVVVALSGSPGAAAARPATAQRALDAAVRLFESFDDENAATALRALLSHAPPGQIAAKAHVYLGLIAFNRFDPETVVHPGHGPATTLGRELASNPFLRELRAEQQEA